MSASTPHTVQPLYGYERGLYAAYDYVDGRADYAKTIYRLTRLGSRALSVLGEVHLQEAANNPDNPAPFLDRASDAFSERIFSNELGFDPKAAIRFAQMSLHHAILTNRQMPNEDVLADSYQAVLWAANTAANHYTFRDDQASRDGRELLGTISEATVLLLATRHAIKKGESWLPVQALLSEDLRSGDFAGGWDISLYKSARSQPPVIKHKLQVKSSLRNPKKYSRDIAVVTISSDLTIDQENQISVFQILDDLQKEANPFASTYRATKRLNLRTDKLRHAINRAK